MLNNVNYDIDITKEPPADDTASVNPKNLVVR